MEPNIKEKLEATLLLSVGWKLMFFGGKKIDERNNDEGTDFYVATN